MFERYRVVAMTYARPTVLLPIIGILLFAAMFSLLIIPVAIEIESSPRESVPDFVSRLLAFSYAASVRAGESTLYFLNSLYLLLEGVIAGLLGFHVKQHIANPRATVVPGFRAPHIAVALIVSVLIVLTLAILLWPVGASIPHACAFLLAVFAISLCASQVLPFLAILPALLAVLIPELLGLLVGEGALGQRMVELMLTRPSTATVAAMVAISVVAIAGWVVRLAFLREEMFDYHSTLPLTRSLTRAQRRLWAVDEQAGVARRLGGLNGYVGDGTWKRAQLWRIGNTQVAPWIVALAGAAFAFLLAVIVQVLPSRPDTLGPEYLGLAVFSAFTFLMPVIYPLVILNPRRDLGCESLRPCSKPQLFRELGLAAAIDMFEMWAIVMFAGIVFALIWAHDVLTMPAVLAALSLSIGWQILAFGIMGWLGHFRSPDLIVLGPLLAIAACVGFALVFLLSPELFELLPAWAAVAGAMALVGTFIAWLAHRQWCQVELGISVVTRSWSKRGIIVFTLFMLVLIAGPKAALLWLGGGPTAAIPGEDPLVCLNRTHADLQANAADLYRAAFSHLQGKPDAEWQQTKNWSPSATVPPGAAAWVAANDRVTALVRQAVQLDQLWFELTPAEDGFPSTREWDDTRTLAKLLLWQARLAAERHDWEGVADAVVAIDRIRRHLQQVPLLLPQMIAIACGALSQETILVPYTWDELSPADRSAYAERIAECFESMPTLTAALEYDTQVAVWVYMTSDEAPLGARILAPAERVCGELTRCQTPLFELAELPVREQADSKHPLRRRIDDLMSEPIPKPNVARKLAMLILPSCTRALELRVRLTTVQRGNRSVVELFNFRDRTGAFPETLESIRGDFEIDPYTGRPFNYRRTDKGFTLYSAGVDRDDDGGQHNRRFGERRDAEPDGDYVFWPPPEPEPNRAAEHDDGER